MPYLTISYVLCASMFGSMTRLDHSALNVLQSYLSFGALKVLLALYRLLLPGRGMPGAREAHPRSRSTLPPTVAKASPGAIGVSGRACYSCVEEAGCRRACSR
jgi:hypothetical protein